MEEIEYENLIYREDYEFESHFFEIYGNYYDVEEWNISEQDLACQNILCSN